MSESGIPPGMIRIVALAHEKEIEQKVVFLLGSGLNGVKALFFSSFDNQANIDHQANRNTSGDVSAVVVMERLWQWARVGQTDFALMGAVQLDFACVQLEPGELVVFADRGSVMRVEKGRMWSWGKKKSVNFMHVWRSSMKPHVTDNFEALNIELSDTEFAMLNYESGLQQLTQRLTPIEQVIIRLTSDIELICSDIQNNEDAARLQKFGSESASEQLSVNICPTCRQRIQDNLIDRR